MSMHCYTEEQKDYVMANYLMKTDKEISAVIGVSNVRGIRNKLGLKKRKPPYVYSQEQVDFLKKYRPNCDCNKLAILFNAEFKTNISGLAITHKCRDLKIYCNISLSELNTTTEIGDTQLTGRNRLMMKTGKGFVFKHRHLYEKYHNVKLSDDDFIVFLDQDKNNFSKNNLYKVSSKINMIMGMNKWFSKNPEVTLAAIKWCELFYAMKEVEVWQTVNG